jgi:alanyl-tRNA synthetase
MGDGVGPSNKDRGYVLRRLLRRCMLVARRLALPADWHRRGVARVVEALGEEYPDLASQRGTISSTIDEEQLRFDRAVAQGSKALRGVSKLDGKVAFDLFQTFGIPFELTLDLAQQTGTTIDRDDFQRALDRHRNVSRTTSIGAFAGGLADHSVENVGYHTLTHLLHAALRRVLGSHVIQRGSNITRERLRFDFSHDRKLTPDEIARVEATVDGWLRRDLRVERSVMSEREARALGAVGAFGEKYGETVSVYTIVDRANGEVVSREFCGGPHVESLGGRMRIVQERALSAGVRRIKAVLEPAD